MKSRLEPEETNYNAYSCLLSFCRDPVYPNLSANSGELLCLVDLAPCDARHGGRNQAQIARRDVCVWRPSTQESVLSFIGILPSLWAHYDSACH
jgi:hypothetical protein